MASKNPTILICCGETSGDIHASALVRELFARIPEARVMAMGGERVEEAGAELLYHMKDYSVVGFSGVLAGLPKFWKLERKLKALIKKEVDLFIPVDYPGLNLRLAAAASKSGVPVLYYIGPQVWAWGEGRVKKIEETVDFMALILPFEKDIYGNTRAEFVGHPFIEDHYLPEPRPWEERSLIGLLPGSRAEEVARMLPVMLEACTILRGEFPGERFAVALAPSVPRRLYERIAADSPLELIWEEDAVRLLAQSKAAIVASGTSTLQAALMETPMIIVYKVSYPNYLVARRLVKVENIGLVNIVLGEEVCREFVQNDARPEAMAEAIGGLLQGGAGRMKMVERFRELKAMLKGTGGCRRVAEVAAELLREGGRRPRRRASGTWS
jgi:lipid-A-disaccharide synthase